MVDRHNAINGPIEPDHLTDIAEELDEPSLLVDPGKLIRLATTITIKSLLIYKSFYLFFT